MNATWGQGPEIHPYLAAGCPRGLPRLPRWRTFRRSRYDLRLSGLARSFGANYHALCRRSHIFRATSYFLKSLAVFIPLVKQIRPVRTISHQPEKVPGHPRTISGQTVTGVVVNSRPNVSRRDYDRRKAILTNCVRRGASTQNHDRHEHFAAHLLGRIAHVAHLNPARGQRLRALYDQIDWNR